MVTWMNATLFAPSGELFKFSKSWILLKLANETSWWCTYISHAIVAKNATNHPSKKLRALRVWMKSNRASTACKSGRRVGMTENEHVAEHCSWALGEQWCRQRQTISTANHANCSFWPAGVATAPGAHASFQVAEKWYNPSARRRRHMLMGSIWGVKAQSSNSSWELLKMPMSFWVKKIRKS